MAHQQFAAANADWITRSVLMANNPLQIHPSAGPTCLANAPMNRVVPVHPGAMRF